MTYNPNAFVPAAPVAPVDPIAAKVTTLEAGIKTLPERDRGFALSLYTFYQKNKFLTEKQLYWVDQLTSKVNIIKSAPPLPTTDLGAGFQKIYELFDKARQSGLRQPKIRLETQDGIQIILRVLGDQSKYKGSVSVTDNARDYASRTYYGRIDQDGKFHMSPKIVDSVVDLMKALAANPAGMAALYGHKTSSCCFCGLELKTRESVAMGYGPICAGNYGLPWGNVAPPTYMLMTLGEPAA